ncbi:bifunctional cytochrome P450/NADPH--P450 reductase [Nonomuraea africana]|uniref:bifunctional cytochrome P450/NADPH--P450 reductase n=1 Tax=Nonomuraea africana TaxID=46171 RepID=UPI0033D8366B
MTMKLPSPPGLPLVGHGLSIPVDRPVAYLLRLARAWGPIFRIDFFGREMTFVSGLDLVSELCDESRFRKNVHDDLVNLRELGGDGLFTAYNDEPNWRKAHDILLPSFSLGAMRGYHERMKQVARGLLAKWERAGDTPVDVAADMTRLTLDTIGLCGFDYDFASFESDEPHPFVEALVRALAYAQAKATFVPGLGFLYARRTARYKADLAYMSELVDELIRRRRATGDRRTDDLLGRMLNSADPLDDLNVRHQVITFLVAGHETTSGALSFALYNLAKHPAALARAQEEVDALWGDSEPDPGFGDVGKLRYIRQVIMESLRLFPTAPAFAVEPLADTVIGGRYEVRKGETLMVLTSQLHRDPAWGDNVELFDPERFAPEREDARPVHAFKAFGSGERACIGRQFALHEATLVLALLVHRFRLVDHDDYQLAIKETLTLKPDGFTLRVAPRTPAPRRAATQDVDTGAPRGTVATGTAITVLHGSTMGTCAGIAHDLAGQGRAYGFGATVASLDQAKGGLPATGEPVVIVTASYNGRPTDDAGAFVEWLTGLEPGSLDGVRYALLGVGDRNWSATYQRIPTLVDDRLRAAGAVPLVERGVADVSGDFAGAVDRWAGGLWRRLLEEYGGAEPDDEGRPMHSVEEVADWRSEAYGVLPMRVLAAEDLAPLGRPKLHLRLALPDGVAYRTGDHFALLPQNPPHLVEAAAVRFGLDLDRTVRIRASRHTRLPVDEPLTIRRLLTEVLDLRGPATPEQVAVLAEHTSCPHQRRALAAGEHGGRGVIDLLAEYAACDLPFARYLDLATMLRPRTYSVSSSALAEPGTVDLMVSPLADGIASAYLAATREGDVLHARVLPGPEPYRLLEDESAPAILVAAGTGLAPFRGVILDRLHRGASGTLLCYFGCDDPDVDYLHRAELEAAESAGVVSMRPAFSKAPVDGVHFVQDRILRESAEVWQALSDGARVYVCGDGRHMAPGVRAAFVGVHRAATGGDAERGEAWLEGLIASGRYVEDVWSGPEAT